MCREEECSKVTKINSIYRKAVVDRALWAGKVWTRIVEKT